MTRIGTAGLVALTLALTAGMVLPAGAMSGSAALEQTNGEQPSLDNVSAEVGQQLSTVLSTTTTEVRSEADDAGFEKRFNESNSTERGEAIAERAEQLENRAAEVRSEYDATTEAYRSSEIEASTFAQRLATLTATANTVERSADHLADRATEIPDAERRALGITDSDLEAISEEIGPVSGRTAGAILSQFTAEDRGEIEIGLDGGIEIEVTSEDDGQSRQFERPRDGDGTYELNQSEALGIATDALSEQNGEWILTSAGSDDGAYEFEFVLDGPGEGEAEVSVDGATGTVFELEESVEAEDDDRDRLERLAIQVTEGEPAPGENVTLTVTGAGEPIAGATVELNDQTVGQTDANGTITITLPSGDADIEATAGEAEGELEFEFEEEDREEELGATADIENGTVTVSVSANGEPVEGATVTANDESVGPTGADGTVSFDLPAGDELEIEIEYGDREAELEYELDDGDDERDEDDDDSDDREEELTIQVTEGEAAPGEMVTLSVTGADGPVENATVELNDETVGQTDVDGTITVTLPDDEEVEIEVSTGDAEGELEFEFEGEGDDRDDDEGDEDERDDDEGDDDDRDDDGDREGDDSDIDSDDEESESESEEVEDEADDEEADEDDDAEETDDDEDGDDDDDEDEDDEDGDDDDEGDE